MLVLLSQVPTRQNSKVTDTSGVISQGDIYVNGESEIIERDIPFRGGVAFGISRLLTPLGFAGQCDEIKDIKTMVR